MLKLMQALIIVDVEGAVTEDELVQLLPDRRDDRLVLSLAAHGAPKIMRRGPEAQPIDWLAIGRAVEAIVKKIRDTCSGKVLQVFVGGQGPLPIFTHIGYAISKFTGEQFVIGRRPSASWEVLPLTRTTDGSDMFAATVLPAHPSHSTGRVAVYIDTAARPANVTAITSCIEAAGDRVADIVEVRTSEALTIDPSNTGQLAEELSTRLARIPAMYPHSSGISIFVAGPTVLAFCTGRAINPSIVSGASLTNYNAGSYDAVYELPFKNETTPGVPMDEASVAARNELRQVLASAISELNGELSEEDIPLASPERQTFLARLSALRLDATQSREFSLSIAQGRYALGDGLVEALRNGERDVQRRFAKLLFVHELFHEHQGVRSTNYFDVGRAGVVLEAVDFAADMFALRVLVRAELRAAAPRGEDGARRILCEWVDAIIYGIQAFDLLNGPRIEPLADRRLRRYLTWHLQRARAETVDTKEDAEAMLESTLTAELAPVAALLDQRGDRVVRAPLPTTEFFAAVDGRLVRHSKRPGFEPSELIEAVRGFNTPAIQKVMRFVIEEDKPKLIPWRR